MEVHHQFYNTEYYFPTWDTNKLFLGTFNPSGGHVLDYYYKRKLNGFWKILKHYDPNNEYNFDDFEDLKNFMTDKEFGCVDVIKRVIFPDNKLDLICGNGYTDDTLFTVTNFTRDYIFEDIKEFINRTNITVVFSTSGKREKPNEFKFLLDDFGDFCRNHNRGIQFINLPSPSGRLYRGVNIERINNSWWEILDHVFVQP
jgi:G:T/U-mismatch repair DNA glycosylase